MTDSELIKYIENKYHIYSDDEQKNKYCVPFLIDACATACNLPYAYHSQGEFNDTVFQDIKNIIRLYPQSLNCDVGYLRCRSGITPLIMAVQNDNIPLEVIEYLLQHGANPSIMYKLNGVSISIEEDLEKYKGEFGKRDKAIIELLEKYKK